MITVDDELKIYRGEDFKVSKYITIHQPTLNEICDYGEEEYFQMVNLVVATPSSMKWQLWDKGIDYTKITPFELFYNITHYFLPKGKTSIIFGELDFSNLKKMIKEDDSPILFQKIGEEYGDGIAIDEYTHMVITDYLRATHNIIKDEKIPANEETKMILIEDDREAYFLNEKKEHHSSLRNLISAMINSEGFKYNHTQVWDMKINAFMDSVKRIATIRLVRRTQMSSLFLLLK